MSDINSSSTVSSAVVYLVMRRTSSVLQQVSSNLTRSVYFFIFSCKGWFTLKTGKRDNDDVMRYKRKARKKM